MLAVSRNCNFVYKYHKVIKINNLPFEVFIDFGSECCMVRQSDFHKLGCNFNNHELPTLRGFGNSAVRALGKRRICVVIDEVKADVDLFIVPEEVMQVPVMIGQSFTEQPHVAVYKPKDALQLLQINCDVKDDPKVKMFILEIPLCLEYL